MAQLAIKGHSTRGKEVIEILEMLGGKNVTNYDGRNTKSFYFINNIIICSSYGSGKLLGIDCYTLEQFLKKFPYKVGDKVRNIIHNENQTITDLTWDFQENEVVYQTNNNEWVYVNYIQPYKEETMEEIIKIDIPKGYEFAGVDDDKQQVVFTKIQLEYPKTYEECCEVLGCKANHFFTNFSYNGCDVEISEYEDKVDDLLQNFRKLRYARDTYWKMAGEQMGLDKPWKPEKTEIVHAIFYNFYDDVIDVSVFNLYDNVVLCFPTEEMRDAFYENFKDLIEFCKELL